MKIFKNNVEKKYSIIIPTYNHLDDCLKPCIESIIKYTELNEDIEIIIVANGCTDNTKEYVESLDPCFKLLWFEDPIGYPISVNYGIQESKGKYIVLLNNDITLLDQRKNYWLDLLVYPLYDKSIGLTGPLKENCDATRIDFMMFFCVAMRRDLIEQVGLLDIIFSPGGGEDIDYSIRVENAGYTNLQISANENIKYCNKKNLFVDNFPIFHQEHKTVSGVKNWNNIITRNFQILRQRYNNLFKYDINKKYSIIIPILNNLDNYIKPCIESIIKYTELNDDIEIIIVANDCIDGTKEYIESLNSCFKVFLVNKNLEYSEIINYGIQESKGKYIVILNNDIILTEQNKNYWLNLLSSPLANKKIGITGPLLSSCMLSGKKFINFFCAAMRRDLIEKIGLLNTVFYPRGGEDVDYCYRVEQDDYKNIQVPTKELIKFTNETDLFTKNFPISFKRYKRISKIEKDKDLLENKKEENNNTIKQISATKKENKILSTIQEKHKLSNNYERAVISKEDDIPEREKSRYFWALENIVGNKILEIGCSSGFGVKILKDIPGIEYLGIDYDEKIIEYAKQNFGNLPGISFETANINNFDLQHYDTIICFECLEHLENGKELAQKLKNHCDCLLITTPYKEPQGFWGPHHKLHNLEENDFPEFEYLYIDENGTINQKPKIFDNSKEYYIYLILMKWTNQINFFKKTVTAVVSTKERYYTTLPLAINSIITQTHKPDHLIIFDDGEHKNLLNDPLYNNIFANIDKNGISWEVVFGERKGQVLNHQKSIDMAKTEFIWRIDDDEIAEPKVLEHLLRNVKSDTGAIGGLVLDPKIDIKYYDQKQYNKIEDINNIDNAQWYKHKDKNIKEVDHLYSSFLFRKEAAVHGYCALLSEVGHREETIFTYEMKRNNWKVLLDPNVTTWHYRNPYGGIRSYQDNSLWEHDEKIFEIKKNIWKNDLDKKKIIVLDSGLGDHIAFANILPDIIKKHPDLALAVCYPEIFKDYNIQLISIEDAKIITNNNIDKDNVYKWMLQNNWQDHIIDAYKEMFLK